MNRSASQAHLAHLATYPKTRLASPSHPTDVPVYRRPSKQFRQRTWPTLGYTDPPARPGDALMQAAEIARPPPTSLHVYALPTT